MQNRLLLPFLAFTFSSLTAQDNISLLSQVTFDENLSNVWGWTSSDGSEYVILGTFDGTYLIDISDPASPVELQFIDGSNSTWRQIAEWNGYAYVVNETADGLLCIDLHDLPGTTDFSFSDGGAGLVEAHQVWADENGIVYVFGSNLYGGSTVMFDASSNPMDPVLMGATDTWYVHHGYARGDTLYESNIYQGQFSVWDVSDKAMPVLLATEVTPGSFTHNVVPSDDGQYLFSTDEKNNGSLAAFDISELDDIQFLSEFRSEPGTNSIPHYAWYKEGFVTTAWYKDGVVITDVSRPEYMVETGSFDTYPGSGSGFSGAWGVYPYFPSGVMAVSDISEGLFILDPDYVPASFLEGLVSDETSGLPVFDALIEIEGLPEATVSSGLTGAYLTGIAGEGLFTVTISASGYADFTTTVSLNSGSTTVLDAALEPVTEICEAPSMLATLDITESGARLDWNNVGAMSYGVVYRKIGGETMSATTTDTYLDIDGLDPCSNYKWRVRAVCPGGTKPKSGIGSFNTIGVSCRQAESLTSEKLVTVYPNPAQDILVVNSGCCTIDHFRVIDREGRTVLEGNALNDGITQLEIRGLSPGLYLLQFADENGRTQIIPFEKL